MRRLAFLVVVTFVPLSASWHAMAASSCKDGEAVSFHGKIDEINEDKAIIASFSKSEFPCETEMGSVMLDTKKIGGNPAGCKKGSDVTVKGTYGDSQGWYYDFVYIEGQDGLACQ